MYYPREETVSPVKWNRTVPNDSPISRNHMDVNNEDHVAVMEKDLALDAPWKRIQQNTFTRWVNEHLKTVNLGCQNLETDFSDGLLLIALVEVLSGRKLPKHTKRPIFRSQKLENVSVALEFLENEENIKLISIDSTDIVEGRLKLILGLVWALVLHYALSKPKWEGDPDSEGAKHLTPKMRLITWFRNRLPSDLPVNNFTTDWNDGRACGALDDAVAPGLCPQWKEWDPKDALRNATEAMSLAEKWLGVPQLIRPEDMIDPNIDEQSMMTYLAQFPIAKLKAGAPIRSPSDKTENHAQASVKSKTGRVYCSGRGLKNGIRVGDVASFKVNLTNAVPEDLIVFIIAPDGTPESFGLRMISEDVCEYSYYPTKVGEHRISVKLSNAEVPLSPFLVRVGALMESNVRVYGPGLSGGAVGYAANFHVDMNGEPGMLGFLIEGPSEVRIDCKDHGDLVANVKYWPLKAGEYAVHVLSDEEDVPGSPFMAEIAELPKNIRPGKVKVDFPNADGIEIGMPFDFSVDCRNAGNGPLQVQIYVKEDRQYEAVMSERRTDAGVYEYSFDPQICAPHSIMVNFAGVAVPNSPFKIPVHSTIVSPVCVSEASLVLPLTSSSSMSGNNLAPLSHGTNGLIEEGVECDVDVGPIQISNLESNALLNQMYEALVDTRAVTGLPDGHLKVTTISPSGISNEALVSRTSAGLFAVSYSVFEEGPHSMKMVYEGIPLHGSPFSIMASGCSSPLSPGMGDAEASQTIHRTSHVSQEISGDGGTMTVIRREVRTVREFISNTYKENAVESGSFGDADVPVGRNFTMKRSDASKVIATVSQQEKAFVSKPNTITVTADLAGFNILLVGIYGKVLDAHEVQVKYMGHARYQVKYVLKERGEYVLSMLYGDEHIPGSPFSITCL